ncbi:MAG: DDE-type integrase/transposase/recombinase [Candidatus Symbiodolus clandestinus]
MDLFSRSIVGMAMKERMNTDLVMSALKQALIRRRPLAGLIHHSDQGSQYTSETFKALSAQQRITLSMSRTGNCYDNAVVESFFHTLKTEHTYFECYGTREQAKQSIFE